jgi:xylulokinase
VGRALALGLDVGTSRIKACLVDAAGRIVGTAAVTTPFGTTPDGVEMTAERLFAAVRDCLQRLGHRLAFVASVGIGTMGETGGVILDGEVAAVPLLAWHDPRGADTVARLSAALKGDAESRTGRRFRTVSSIAKLGWLSDHGFDLSGEWTGVGGLVAWRLTGNVAQEESLAATTGAFDLFRRDWDRQIISAAGLTRVRWPRVVSGIDPVGAIGSSGSEWSGIPKGVPVCIAGHDHPVGVVGVGARPTDIVDSMGTSEPLATGWSRSQDRLDDLPFDGEVTVTSWPGASGLMLLWEVLRPGLARTNLSEALGTPQQVLDDEALGEIGECRPLEATELRALESGVPHLLGPDRPAHLWRAMLAGFALEASRAEAWIRSTRARDDTLLIGGGSRSRAWVREKSLVAVRRPRVVDQPESVAYGAALLGAVPAGFWPQSELPRPDRQEVSAVLAETVER